MSKLLVDEIGGNAAAATTIASGKNITGTASQFQMTDVVQGDVLYGSAADTLSRLAPGTSGQLLTSGGAGANPSWTTVATATNAPAFSAHLSASQTIAASNTLTKVECDTEIFDSDSKYDNSTDYRFTPGTIGKYYVSCQIQMQNSIADNMSDLQICIYKNGVIFKDSRIVGSDHVYYSPGEFVTMHLNFIMDLNATDYIEMWGAQQEIAASTKYFSVGQQATAFSAFKLIGI